MPSELLGTDRETFVCVFVKLTVALVAKPHEASFIVPTRVPVTFAEKRGELRAKAEINKAVTKN